MLVSSRRNFWFDDVRSFGPEPGVVKDLKIVFIGVLLVMVSIFRWLGAANWRLASSMTVCNLTC